MSSSEVRATAVRAGDPIFVETARQAEFARAVFSGRYRYLGFGGGIRGGKTFLMLALVCVLCRIYPRSRWAIVRRDLPTLRRNTMPSFNKLRPRSFVGEINQTTWTSTCTNGSEILFFSESIDVDPDLDRWKGLEVNGFVLEEANELDVRSFYKAMERAGAWIIPTQAGQAGQAMQPPPLVLCTFNPAPNWVKRTFYDPWAAGQMPEGYYYLPALAADNPYNTDAYLAGLKHLPESEYRRFVMGDWENMTGAALDELNGRVHVVPRFAVPRHWEQFGAFDWGFAHPWVFGWFAADEDGSLYLIDTVTGRRDTPREIAEKIRERVPVQQLRYVHAGHDCWHEHRAMGENTPTIAETFQDYGLLLAKANIDRRAGLNNLREYVAWKGTLNGADGRRADGDPALRFFDTPTNRWGFEQMLAMTLDPADPEKPLKVDADPSTGDGGDDFFDMVRYGAASRPRRARSTFADQEVRAWSRETLAFEREQLMRVQSPSAKQSRRRGFLPPGSAF